MITVIHTLSISSYLPNHLYVSCSLTAIDNIMDLEVEGDVGVGKPIVRLPRLPGEEHSSQEREWCQVDIGWWYDVLYRGIRL